MIQLRQLQVESKGYPLLVLQYRFQYDPTVSAGVYLPDVPNPNPLNRQVWSEWQDVPVVKDING